MRTATGKTINTLRGLRVLGQSDSSLELTGTGCRAMVQALVGDLFRVRVCRGKAFSTRPSWSVCRTEWPVVPTEIDVARKRIRLRTESGAIEITPQSGEFLFLDACGKRVLSSDPAMTGFVGRRARVTFRLTGGESFFAMGESSGPFDRRGLLQKFWSTDALGHGGINPGLRNLYTSIPFTMMWDQGRAMGVFWDNPARQEWDLGQTDRRRWQMSAASGEMDLYLFTGPRITDIVQRYAELTGHIPMPPRWALGYHQCRYSYESRIELEKIAQQLRKRQIPCDALYLDIHHMDGYRVFTFGKSYPKPGDMIRRLRQQGFRTVAIVDPGVKKDNNFGVFQRGRQKRAYIRTPDGKRDYVGAVWPGRSVFPDFLRRDVREWWGQEQSKFQRLGVAGFWNDMNEPSNFAFTTKTLPENCRHSSDFGPMRHAEAHNLYGMQMSRACREGALKHRPSERPFVITRATYAGGQRHSMVWTGDNASSWEHLADSVQMLLNLGLSGFPFCGGDAGGFLDNCTPELYARWMQLAAFTPFFRNHTMLGTLPHEPWAFGEEVESIVRSYIELRYQLLPYWYCLFAEAHRTGAPIMRPLLWHHQDDPIAAHCGDQFMVGPSVLVAPVLEQGAVARAVYLPQGRWFNFWTGKRYCGRRHVVAEAPLHRLPLYMRAGSIVPTIALAQHTAGPAPSVINLHIWPGAAGALDWYEDDGHSMHHLNGKFHRRTITVSHHQNGLTLHWMPGEGDLRTQVRRWRIIVHEVARRHRVSGLKGSVRFDAELRLLAVTVNNPLGRKETSLELVPN